MDVIGNNGAVVVAGFAWIGRLTAIGVVGVVIINACGVKVTSRIDDLARRCQVRMRHRRKNERCDHKYSNESLHPRRQHGTCPSRGTWHRQDKLNVL